MKSIFDESTLKEVEARFNKLSKDSEGLWGKMSVGQMLWHCQIFVKDAIKNKKYTKEMVYASLYFEALKKFSFKNQTYPVIVCNETYLDIQKVKKYLKKLAKANGFDYQISDSHASQCEMLKVSDIIAASPA